MTKEKILQNYKKGLMSDFYRNHMRDYNRSMYPSCTEVKSKNCEYYLYPAYVRVDDKFTDKEILDNFYIGDLMEIDLEVGTAEEFFGEGWNPETGNGKWGK